MQVKPLRTKQRLAITCCKSRAGDGLLCGDIWVRVTYQGKKRVRTVCLTHNHLRPRVRLANKGEL